MANPFLIPGEYRDTPAAFYARVDQVEVIDDPEGPVIARLDCIGAEWLDARVEGDVWASLPEAPLAIIEVQVPAARLDGPLQPLREEDAWRKIWFNADGTGNALRFRNLFGEGEPGSVIVGASPSPTVMRCIERQFTLYGHGVQLDVEGLLQLLEGRTDPDFLGILDVGQGNFNGLWCDGGAAQLFFDAGGGVTAHASTFPPGFVLCGVCVPPVVLSHWDWDHWSSGCRFPALQACPWIVPDQGVMGGVHAAFAGTLSAAGMLHVWPAGLAAVHAGRVTIERCTGVGRNRSGLAMLVAGPDGAGRRVALTADAGYDDVPSIAGGGGALFATLVPHHGGRSRGHLMATPLAPHVSRAVYSYGLPNHYGHPATATVAAHNAWWRLDTPWPVPTPLGTRPCNVGVSWSRHPHHGTACGNCCPVKW